MRTIGIDPGDHAVKVVELDGSYKKTRLVHAGMAVVPAEDAAARPAAKARAIVEVMGDGARGEVHLAHPCREAVLRPLELPFKGREAIRKVVKAEIEGEIQSQSVDDMVVDFHEIGPGQSGGTKLLVAAVPKQGLRSILSALAVHKIEPEQIDLDNMALWRVAHWAGAFAKDAGGGDLAASVTAVVDLGAHSVNVILVEGEHLVEMRVVRIGDGVVADEIARKYGLDNDAARAVVQACISSGADQRLEVAAAVPAVAPKAADDDVAAPAVTAPARVVVVKHAEVEAAHVACLQRIARELTRFLTASGRADRIGAVWATGGTCRTPGTLEMLTAVFGVEARELDLLANLQHDLTPEQATEYGPRLAIALGMALGPLGGPSGFELRQEDLLLTRGFERIKFPLAITCMIALLALFVHWNLRRAQLRNLEIEVGLEYIDKKKPTALPIFYGMLNAVFATPWFDNPQQFRLVKQGKDYVYKDLVAELVAAPVHRRLTIVRDRLREVADQKQRESGIYEDVSLESGLAVLVRWSELLRGVEKDLGRYLVTKVDLTMKAPNRRLEFSIAFRGEDFRLRRSALQRAIDAELERADSPFEKPKRAEEGKSEEPFRDSKETGVDGAFFRVVLHVKESFRPFGPGVGAPFGMGDTARAPSGDALAKTGGGK